MELSELNPYIRFCAEVTSGRTYPEPLLAYDFRLFYVRNGQICMEIGTSASEYDLFEDMLAVIPAGVPYRLIFEREATYDLLNFDMDQSGAGLSSRAPVPAAQYQTELRFSADAPEFFGETRILHGVRNAAELLTSVKSEFRRFACSDALCSAWLRLLLTLQCRMAEEEEKTANDPRISEILTYIRKHCTENLRNTEIARRFGYHSYYLNTLFQQKTGQSLHSCLLRARLEESCRRLEQGRDSLSEIATQCGFCSASHFSQCFAREYGISPGQYRLKIR